MIHCILEGLEYHLRIIFGKREIIATKCHFEGGEGGWKAIWTIIESGASLPYLGKVQKEFGFDLHFNIYKASAEAA